MRNVYLFCLSLFVLVGASPLHAAFNVQEFTTAKGIKVRYREDKSTPVISLNFSIEYGSARDPKGLEGTGTLLASMMTEGTKTKSVEELADIRQDLSISLNHKIDLEHFSAYLTTLRKNKDKAFGLFKETIFESAFKEEAFKRAKKEILTILAMKEHDPGYQVSLKMAKMMYGDHPFARPKLGTIESVKKIEIQDLKDFMKHFSRDKILVAVAGNISKEEIEAHVDDLFESLPETVEVEELPKIATSLSRAREVIKKEVPQTVMTFVQKGLRYDHEKFITLILLNRILNEKLRLEVREKRGLTYHVGASPRSNSMVGHLGGGCATKNKSAGEAIESILKVFSDFKDKGCTDQEFNDAKSYSMGSYILNFEDTPGISGSILALMQIKRSKEYLDIRNDLMAKVTKEDVEALARELLDPENMAFVLYGTPEGVS